MSVPGALGQSSLRSVKQVEMCLYVCMSGKVTETGGRPQSAATVTVWSLDSRKPRCLEEQRACRNSDWKVGDKRKVGEGVLNVKGRRVGEERGSCPAF